MERIRFVTHRGQRVLLLDFTNCKADEVAEIADQAPPVVTQEPPGSVLLLADFTGAEFSRESVEHVKVAAAMDKRHLKRDAWVLDHNLPKALYDSIRSFSARELPIFPTREAALEYLTADGSV
ncbi:MAG TPA: hypothetical protein VFB04_13390 [Terriglobales bacterium]|nr:hypothetical protein [Terriglobales bacterium]